jgi:hypothetical protein
MKMESLFEDETYEITKEDQKKYNELLFVSSFVFFLTDSWTHPISSYFSPQLAVIHTHTSSTSTHNFVSVSFCLGAFVTTSLSTFLFLFVPSQPFSPLSSSQSSLSEPRLSH